MILFLGAGASKIFGIPDTKGFIELFEGEIGKSELFQKVKSAFVDRLADGQFDIEKLLTILNDLSKSRDELMKTMAPHTAAFLLTDIDEAWDLIQEEDIKKEASELLSKTKRMIREKCFTQVNKEKPQILEVYDKFFGSLPVRKSQTSGSMPQKVYPTIKVFTTNYDTCIEAYFNERQVNYTNGSLVQYGELIFDVNIFLNNVHPIELVKLHGSIDMFVKDRRIRFLHGMEPVGTGIQRRVHDISG